jgi:hypothetical protein
MYMHFNDFKSKLLRISSFADNTAYRVEHNLSEVPLIN